MKARYIKLWLVAAVFFGTIYGFEGVPQAQPSPIGVWDLNITGHFIGSAVIQFFQDNTLGGVILVRGKSQSPKLPDTLAQGFTDVIGEWSVNPKGQLIGFFSGGTEELPIDMSFTGSIKGINIKLDATGTDGRWHLRGGPAVDLPFIADSWTALVVKDRAKFSEIFTLTPVDVCIDDPTPADISDCFNFLFGHLYLLDGTGAGYTTTGAALVNIAGAIGVALEEETSGIVRSGTGKLRGNNNFSVTGSDEEHAIVKMTATGN
ncbi:MAG TPA: hypothetical protein VGH50_11450 [Candidatus Binatia bacterium]|jgi:hypothetical protein